MLYNTKLVNINKNMIDLSYLFSSHREQPLNKLILLKINCNIIEHLSNKYIIQTVQFQVKLKARFFK